MARSGLFRALAPAARTKSVCSSRDCRSATTKKAKATRRRRGRTCAS
jgi:hypothetical protein